MTTQIQYARVRGHCQELLATLRLPRTCGTEEFACAMGRHTGSSVRLMPLRLPETCPALWLGDTGADRVGYNQDWPAHAISLAGHAVGHLALGHCDQIRDGGQFACTVAKLGEDDRRLLGRHLHDPEVSRLFSDGEEYAATVFTHVLAEWIGIKNAHPDGHITLTCVG
jgi:hypothetical protein